MIPQEVNLYKEQFKKSTVVLGLDHMLILTITVIILTIGTHVYIDNQIKRLTGEESSLSKSIETINGELNLLRSENDEAQFVAIKEEIGFLRNVKTNRTEILGQISLGGDAENNGYSEHLKGLSRQHRKGMSLTNIQIDSFGQMTLEGVSTNAKFVSEFIDRLKKEKLFNGSGFSSLVMDEGDSGLVNFRLQGLERE